MDNIEDPITLKECAAFLKKSVSTIYNYVNDEDSGIPFHKKGKNFFFFKSELIKWIKE